MPATVPMMSGANMKKRANTTPMISKRSARPINNSPTGFGRRSLSFAGFIPRVLRYFPGWRPRPRCLEPVLFLSNRKKLGRVGGDDLVFCIGSNDLDGNMFEACEKEPLPHSGLKKQIFFLVGQVEGFLEHVDGRRGLFQKELYGRVRKDGAAIGRAEEILNVLRNRRD